MGEHHGSEESMSGFHIVEKRVPIFDDSILHKLGELGVQISGGSGVIHAHIWIPPGKEEEVLAFLKTRGFVEAEPY